jgi:hypothetical protein
MLDKIVCWIPLLETLQACGKDSEENRSHGRSGHLSSFTLEPLLKFGNMVPRIRPQAVAIIQSSVNSNWKDSEAMEMR